jgi:hypothetical protein
MKYETKTALFALAIYLYFAALGLWGAISRRVR